MDVSGIWKGCFGGIFLILPFLIKSLSLINTGQTQTEVWNSTYISQAFRHPETSQTADTFTQHISAHLHSTLKACPANLHCRFPPALQTTCLWATLRLPCLMGSYWSHWSYWKLEMFSFCQKTALLSYPLQKVPSGPSAFLHLTCTMVYIGSLLRSQRHNFKLRNRKKTCYFLIFEILQLVSGMRSCSVH